MPDRPTRLPPMGGALFGPTNMPDKPLHLPQIQQSETGKGKAPAGGKIFPKKGTPQSSQEDVTSEDAPKPKLTQLTPAAPPPFRMTRQPLPPVGGMTRTQLPIGVRSSQPGFTSPASGMPPRRTALDPFTTGLTSPQPLGGLSSPARMTPAPLQPVRLPSTRPTLSPTKSPTKVTTVGSLSPMSPPTATKPPETTQTSDGAVGDTAGGGQN